MKPVVDQPWTKTKEDVIATYNVDEDKGLSEERVREDLEYYGPNGNALESSWTDPYCFSIYRITSRRGQTTLETHFGTIRRSTSQNSTSRCLHFIRQSFSSPFRHTTTTTTFSSPPPLGLSLIRRTQRRRQSCCSFRRATRHSSYSHRQCYRRRLAGNRFFLSTRFHDPLCLAHA